MAVIDDEGTVCYLMLSVGPPIRTERGLMSFRPLLRDELHHWQRSRGSKRALSSLLR